MKRVWALMLVAGCTTTPDPNAGPGAVELTIDRSKLPGPGVAPSWGPPPVQRFALDNGMSVWHLQQSQAPLVSLRLVFPNGGAVDPADMAGLTDLTADMLDEGAGKNSALELSDALQRLATDYWARTRTDGVELSMDMLSDNVDPSVALLADIVQRPTLSKEEFERRKAERVAAALAEEATPDVGRAAVLRRAIFGNGYGSQPTRGTKPGLESVTLKDVKAHHAALFAPDGAAFVVVGAIDRAATESVLKKHFGAWTGKPTVQPAPPTRAALEKGIHLVDYPGAQQTGVSVVARAPGQGAKDYFAGEVFSWVLGESFTSRLNMNLREDKGYTYGAYAWFNRYRSTGYYSLTARVKTDTTRASIDEMFRELKGTAGSKPITPLEHEEAIGGLRLGFPRKFERISSLATQLVDLPLYGRDPAWFAQWTRRVSDVTLDAANATAKLTSQPDDFVIVLAGDRAAIEPSLKSLGLPVMLYDATGKRL